MKTNSNQFKDFCVSELSFNEIKEINGGKLGYDIGFFFREVGIILTNGGGVYATMRAVEEYALNYRPLN